MTMMMLSMMMMSKIMLNNNHVAAEEVDDSEMWKYAWYKRISTHAVVSTALQGCVSDWPWVLNQTKPMMMSTRIFSEEVDNLEDVKVWTGCVSWVWDRPRERWCATDDPHTLDPSDTRIHRIHAYISDTSATRIHRIHRTHLIHAYIAYIVYIALIGYIAYFGYIPHIGYTAQIATANPHTSGHILGCKQHSIATMQCVWTTKKHKQVLDAVLVNIFYYSDTLQHSKNL